MLHEIDKMEDETQYPKKTIDYLMGFNIKFLPHFTKITILVRETNAHLGKPRLVLPTCLWILFTKLLKLRRP